MAPCSDNPHSLNSQCPLNGKVPRIKENPDSINSMSPSWNFSRCDKEGRWAFTEDKMNKVFWEKLLPRLQSYEQQSWLEFSGPDKESHFIKIDQLNKCAQQRLEELKINEEEIFSLRIEGKIRLYGLRHKATLIILWYDDDHGDNDTSVCRSHKKHT
jgi:hypothetical protein